MVRAFVVLLTLLLTRFATAQEVAFDDTEKRPLDVRETSTREQDGMLLREISYTLADGSRNSATVVEPRDAPEAARPAVLFVHWYGPPRPTSNRTQFIPDAVELSKGGAVSLLVDTPWSEPNWFRERKRENDYAFSVQQVKDLRRALDVLMQLPKADPARVAYVGHDFGAMYGALTAANDPRVKFLVFMAGTQSFSDWFLYGPKPPPEEQQKFIAQLAPLDPVRYLPKVKAPVLLQFADEDEHVSTERAQALAAAADEPKTVRTYHSDHELNAEATRERLAWLREQLEIPPP